MKRYIAPITIAALGASMFIIGATQAAPAPEPTTTTAYVPEPWEPPVAEPIDDVQPIVHEPGTFETTPQHDQCWSNEDVSILLESGDFVIYGNDDPRRWGTHSIGAMNCGPADLPFPEPAPVEPAPEPVVAATDPAACAG